MKKSMFQISFPSIQFAYIQLSRKMAVDSATVMKLLALGPDALAFCTAKTQTELDQIKTSVEKLTGLVIMT
jgi:hypothetical protein